MAIISDWVKNTDRIISNMSPNRRIIYFCSENRNIIQDVIHTSLALCAQIDETASFINDKLCPPLETFMKTEKTDVPKCLILTDFQSYTEMEQNKFLKFFLDDDKLKQNHSLLLISSPMKCIPDGFSNEIELIIDQAWNTHDISLAIKKRICRLKADRVTSVRKNITDEEIEKAAEKFYGLTNRQITDILDKMADSIVEDLSSGMYVEQIEKERKNEAEKDNTITFEEYSDKQEAAGLKNYFDWLNERTEDYKHPEQAIANGTTAPKGVLLCGVPGTGKTLLAKETARILGNIPLVNFDISKINDSKFGGSEVKMKRYLDRIDALGECVMLIDEIEKTFRINEQTHEVKMAMLGQMLKWLQNRKGNAFTFMTANDITQLPMELVRDGRISGRFFLFMPSRNDLVDILCIKLRKLASMNSQFFDEDFKKMIFAKENDKCVEKFGEIFDEIARRAKEKSENGQYRVPFMTGANLEKLFEDTNRCIRKNKDKNEKTFPPYSFDTYKKTMVTCADSDDFITQAQLGMSKLTDMWLFMLENQYQNASGDSILPLNRFKDGKFSSLPKRENEYDKYYQEIFKEEIEKEAKKRMSEHEALQRAGYSKNE